MAEETREDGPGPAEDAGGTAKSIDEGWKAEAKREKEKLDEKLAADEQPPLPPAEFLSFLSGIAAQALMQLGEIDSPIYGKRIVDLDAARYSIDVIGILEEKTKGNLTDEEARYVAAALHDLRMRYVAAAKGQLSAKDADGAAG